MKERAVLIDIVDPETEIAESVLRLNELDSLVKTYGGVTVLKSIQKRSKPAYKTYVGEGKLEAILLELDSPVDVIILNNLLKPRQIYNIEEFCHNFAINQQKAKSRFEVPKKIKVWDRIDLILKIFDKHANTAEAKLQIELASIKHMGPRIFGMGLELSRQAGGIGTVGIGETNIEIMKRHLKQRTKVIEDKIKIYGDIQSRQRSSRRSKNLRTLALAGYTNAGKSTLIKALTKKQEVYIADALFATLDSKVGELFLPNLRQKVMIADTIGFIQDLPPSLIQAFKTTLAEIIDADLILHVIDASDLNLDFKISVVENILDELLEGKNTPRIFVFNKMDLVENSEKLFEILTSKYHNHKPQFVSALDKGSLQLLINQLENDLRIGHEAY